MIFLTGLNTFTSFVLKEDGMNQLIKRFRIKFSKINILHTILCLSMYYVITVISWQRKKKLKCCSATGNFWVVEFTKH